MPKILGCNPTLFTYISNVAALSVIDSRLGTSAIDQSQNLCAFRSLRQIVPLVQHLHGCSDCQLNYGHLRSGSPLCQLE